jgi:hypothetical protein
LPPAVANVVADGARLFPGVQPSNARLPAFSGNKKEYASLIVRQLRAERLRLRLDIVSGGPCFFISKPGKKALRHLWNGTYVTDAALPAPAPRHLANPSTFAFLRASIDRPLYLSTRDCRSWFEQLSIPEQLRPYMGQQPIRGRTLLSALDLSLDEMRSYLDDLPTPLSDRALLEANLFLCLAHGHKVSLGVHI